MGEKEGYAKRLVCEMPRKGDCGSAKTAVPLHPEKIKTKHSIN